MHGVCVPDESRSHARSDLPLTTQARLVVRHSSCSGPVFMLTHWVTPDCATHADAFDAIAGSGPSAQPWRLCQEAAVRPPSNVSYTPAAGELTTVARR